MPGTSRGEVSYTLSPGQWTGPEPPGFPQQLPMYSRLFVTRGTELKLISSVYCLCLSFRWQVKLDAFYLSTFDLLEEKIAHGPDSACWAVPLCKSRCVFSALITLSTFSCLTASPRHFSISSFPIRLGFCEIPVTAQPSEAFFFFLLPSRAPGNNAMFIFRFIRISGGHQS